MSNEISSFKVREVLKVIQVHKRAKGFFEGVAAKAYDSNIKVRSETLAKEQDLIAMAQEEVLKSLVSPEMIAEAAKDLYVEKIEQDPQWDPIHEG